MRCCCFPHHVFVCQGSHHDDYADVLLPDHPPEVGRGVAQRTLRADEVSLGAATLHAVQYSSQWISGIPKHKHSSYKNKQISRSYNCLIEVTVSRSHHETEVIVDREKVEFLPARSLRLCSRHNGGRPAETASPDSGHLEPPEQNHRDPEESISIKTAQQAMVECLPPPPPPPNPHTHKVTHTFTHLVNLHGRT